MSYPHPINDILAQIGNDLPTNSEGLITAEALRNVLTPLVTVIYDTLAAPDAVVLAQFPEYSRVTTYIGRTLYVVRFDDQLWQFMSFGDQKGVDPGTNPTVWRVYPAMGMMHRRNNDYHLAEQSPYRVSALEIREHIDNEAIHEVHAINLDVTLQPSAILDSYINPVEIIAAPGEGKVLVGMDLYFMVIPGTNDYPEPALIVWSSGNFYPEATNYNINRHKREGIPVIVRLDHDSKEHEINSGLFLKSQGEQTEGNHIIRVFGTYWIKDLAR